MYKFIFKNPDTQRVNNNNKKEPSDNNKKCGIVQTNILSDNTGFIQTCVVTYNTDIRRWHSTL